MIDVERSFLELCIISCVRVKVLMQLSFVLGSGCSCFGKRSACVFRVQDESQFELELFFMCSRSEVSAALQINIVVFWTLLGLIGTSDSLEERTQALRD